MSLYHKFYFALLPFAGNYAYGQNPNIIDRICYHMVLILPLPKGRES